MDHRAALSLLVLFAGSLTTQRVLANVSETRSSRVWRLAVRGGWWDAGIDATTPQGVFLSAGIPWVLYLPVFAYGGQQGLMAVDASVGYRHAVSNRTSLSGKLLTVWSYDWGDPCGDSCSVHTHRLFLFPVAGVRHRFASVDENERVASGVILGLDLALAVLSVHRSDDSDAGWRLKNIPIWAGPAFSQAYVGYEW